MGSFSKRMKRSQDTYIEAGSEEELDFDDEVTSEQEIDNSDVQSDDEVNEDEGESEGEEDEEGDEEEDEEENEKEAEEDAENVGGMLNDGLKYDEMEELEKEYKELQDREKSLIQNLKRHKDEDLLKGHAVKSQKALWNKVLELRIQLQKVFHNSNKLPQEPIRSLFCESDKQVSTAYSDLIASSKKTINSLVQLQEALSNNNPSIIETKEVYPEGESQSSLTSFGDLHKMDAHKDKEWLQIFQMQQRVAPFRNKAIDKWQRKADVNSGAVAKKAKLLAFNQNISDQVATYMRDPSKMIRSMQMKREQVGVFGFGAQVRNSDQGNADGDPELLADSEFYQQLLREFLETVDHATELAYDVPRKSQTKKRKLVDRRASKSRKIRYHVHEKIVNFMAPQPMDLPPMAPMLFDNLFGLKTTKPTSAA